MKLIKINLSKKQNAWIGWMMGGPSFSEYGSEGFDHDRGLSPEESEAYTKAYDQVSHGNKKQRFEFPRSDDVYSEIIFDMNRLIDMMEDGRTGYWVENDRAIFSDQQSIRALIRKVEAAWEESN
tara:strand:+ start:947 stop:1318 length:372 start_codon:yes stop_codon:yes gene_type:complete